MLPPEERASGPRPVDPAEPGDGGAGGITTPEGNDAGEAQEPHGGDRPREDIKEIEVGDPRDGP
jgi:hypothetical protein